LVAIAQPFRQAARGVVASMAIGSAKTSALPTDPGITSAIHARATAKLAEAHSRARVRGGIGQAPLLFSKGTLT
jgi:hypothetical protein